MELAVAIPLLATAGKDFYLRLVSHLLGLPATASIHALRAG
jgi:hypothetical protein